MYLLKPGVDDHTSEQLALLLSQKKMIPIKNEKDRSVVWQYFSLVGYTEQDELYHLIGRCVCDRCGHVYRAGGELGTGNLLSHIRKCRADLAPLTRKVL